MQQNAQHNIALQRPGPVQTSDVEAAHDSGLLSEGPFKYWMHSNLEQYLVRPKTRKGQILCWSFWLIALAAGCVLFWQVLPRFVDHVVKPTLKFIERHFTKPQVAAIALAAMAIFPVLLISSTPVMLLVSAVLGFWWGFLVATIGTSIGMLLAFLVGKQIFKDRLHRWVQGNHKAEAMLLAISEAGTFKVIVLMRQVVPYTWLNYAASAPPEITLPWYMLASVIGQIPHNAVDVYLGGNVTGLGDLLKGKPANTATIVTYTLGFSAAILVAGLAYFYAKRALRKIEQRAQAQEQDLTVPPPRLQGDTLVPFRQKSGLPNFQEGLIRQQSQEPMLAQQYTSMLRTASGDSLSPTSSASRSPSHRRLLSPTNRFAADIETASRSV